MYEKKMMLFSNGVTRTIIRTSLSVEDLRDTIANECIDREDVDRDSFWKGAEFALEQLGIPLVEEKDDA